jgi:hypothetical protein
MREQATGSPDGGSIIKIVWLIVTFRI